MASEIEQINGTELFRRTISAEYQGRRDFAELLAEVWSPTPWMVDVLTEGRDDEIRSWCYRMFGPESSPIHKKEGGWHRANVTMHGKTWFGFRTEAKSKYWRTNWSSNSTVLLRRYCFQSRSAAGSIGNAESKTPLIHFSSVGF